MYIFNINVRIFKNQLYKLLHKYMQHYYYIHALVNFESSFYRTDTFISDKKKQKFLIFVKHDY
jgi:hypothetical protein